MESLQEHSELCCQTRKTPLTSTTVWAQRMRTDIFSHLWSVFISRNAEELREGFNWMWPFCISRVSTCRRQRSSDMVRSCLERVSSNSSSFQLSPSPGGKHQMQQLSQQELFILSLAGVWKWLLHRLESRKDCTDKNRITLIHIAATESITGSSFSAHINCCKVQFSADIISLVNDQHIW